MNLYDQQLSELGNIFGNPSNPIKGRVYTKIKKQPNGKYLPLVKVSLFGKWKSLHWHFYNQQPNIGFTEMKAVLTSINGAYPYKLEDANQLIDDFKKYRSSGITIW